jgi:hypothetical protein
MMAKTNSNAFDWGFWFYWMMATTVGWILGRLLLPNLAFIAIGLSVGIMQWFVLQHRLPRAWRWILVTTLGWTLGSALILPFRAEGLEFVVGLIMGITTGFCQWLFLRQEVILAGWWIVIMIIGWTSGLAFFPGLLLTGVIVGIITGFGLELLLRNPKPGVIMDEPG